ncbi:1-deoxy-D-xylulose-5-phosphate synthase [uncultured Sutterella sp.]|uniref:1-deoxy-D-xylulose-5-phosphate synthase n=1 Tax=uncultured Sutterella sp. TaxID=286133 RepID=UPI0026351E21|nr:1-deoxy-D-xylulose-5-phosphate synthase [uncultured Sutterella sp.]
MFSGTSHKASSSGEIDYSAPMDYPLLDEVTGVDALRKLPVEELPELARELRHFMVRSVAKTGGHLSSSLGAVELAIALHYVFNTPYDRIIWDVGHQAYAHKILTGRREGMAKLRMLNGLSGFPKRSESPFDAFGTAHSSTSISAALGMAVAAHLEGQNDRWAIAVIGDGALTGGMAIEALNDAGVWKKGLRLLVIVNDNDCSISPPAGALSKHLAKIVSTRAFNSAREMSKRMMKPIPRLWEVAKLAERQTIGFLSPQSALFSAFDINYYGPVDGHDVESLVSVLKNLREMDRPIVLHVATMKGKGYAPAEADPTLYHGVSPFDPAKGIVKSNAPSKPTYTQVFSRWICDMAAHDKRLYAITPAMREGSGLVEFNRLYPDRYRDVAIAEQHSGTYAAGLACGGMKPVLAIYSTFLQRGLDQLIHDVALQNLPVMFAIDRGGIVGADGATHQGVFDIVELRSVPNMTVMTPSDERETRLMLNTAYFMETPASVRYPRGKGPGVEAGTDFETIPIGVSKTLMKGSKAAFLGFGSMTGVLKPVAEALGGTLIDMRFVKPIDRDAILEAARTHELIVTAEEGALMGGAGDAVMEVLADAGVALPVMRFGIPDEFIEQGTQKEIYELLGLTPQAIEAKVRERLAEIELNKAEA